MPNAIFLRELGDPERLNAEDVEPEALSPEQIRVQHTAIGVNFIDTYFRRGLYPTKLPAIIGDQAVGSVTDVGAKVNDFAVGDTVAYASAFGAYRTERCLDPAKVVKIDQRLDSQVVAATLTRGLTAEYLLFRLHGVKPGETVVVHAAAGGTGAILCRWAKALGAIVIGTVGDRSKIRLAASLGCDHVLIHSGSDFVEQIKSFTDGELVDVVYDSIGKDTFERSLDCIKPRGLMVAFGNASGKPPALDVLSLATKGSLFLTRPSLSHYIRTREEFLLSAERYFEALRNRIIKPPTITPFALGDAASAHRHLEDRAKSSIPILIP